MEHLSKVELIGIMILCVIAYIGCGLVSRWFMPKTLRVRHAKK